MHDKSLTVYEAAAILGVSVATVRRRCASGQLPARKVGRSWIVDGRVLPRQAPRRPPRRLGKAASSLVDLETAITHLIQQDLRQDVWVPDVLRHEDDLSDRAALVRAARDRIDGNAVHDPPLVIPVPKSPFFLRHSVDLSLVDRLAFHGVVASFAPSIEAVLSDSVYSARITAEEASLLKNGRDCWLAWRRDVIKELKDGKQFMLSTDVTAYFDFVKHEVLIQELQQLGVEDRLLQALRRMLREWCPASNTGIPQGPDASRVLGNFYMAPVDHVMNDLEEVMYFRYMDDIRIVGTSRSDVIGAFQQLGQECRRRGLALSAKKTELLIGDNAVKAMEESELDSLQYAFESKEGDDTALRLQLTSLFERACNADGTIKMRWARFSLFRLLQMRERSVLSRVLKSLENLAPLGGLIPMYLHPWLRRGSTKRRIAEYLEDTERNTSPYLSCWLMAVMLDIPDAIDARWIDYARGIALNRAEPAYHRGVALNMLALGKKSRDLEAISDVIRYEHNPEVVRAALVALRRVDSLTRGICKRTRRIPGLERTVSHLRERNNLPSLVFRARRIHLG